MKHPNILSASLFSVKRMFSFCEGSRAPAVVHKAPETGAMNLTMAERMKLIRDQAESAQRRKKTLSDARVQSLGNF